MRAGSVIYYEMKLFRRTYSAIVGFVICVSIVQWVNWTAYEIEPDLYVWTALTTILLVAMLALLFVIPGKPIAILTAIGGTSALLVWLAVSAGAYTWIIPLSEMTGVWKYENALRRYPDKSLSNISPLPYPRMRRKSNYPTCRHGAIGPLHWNFDSKPRRNSSTNFRVTIRGGSLSALFQKNSATTTKQFV